MSLLTVKLGRDLRASWSRFVLMVLALAVSVTVFGGMLTAWATVRQETRGAYLSTQPASATFEFDRPVDASRMAEIATAAKQLPRVLETTGRTQFESKVAVNGRELSSTVLTFAAAPDDPMRMVKFDLEEGTWPVAPGDVLVRRDSLPLLGAKVGDTITLDGPDGKPLPLRITGTVYDPSLAPSPQEQRGFAYVSSDSLAKAGQPQLDQLKIQVADKQDPTVSSDDRADIAAVAGQVGSWLQKEYGVGIAEVQIPKPYEHPHEWQANVLLLSLLAGGAAALLLSAILVATMLNNLFTLHIPQIGIMKAIGARSGRIGGYYLIMTLLVAAVATLLGLVPAIILGQGRIRGLLALIAIEPTSLVAPWWAYAGVVAMGVGLPPLLALVPLIRTSRTTVRAAIDHHGNTAKPSAASGLLARLSRIRKLDRGLLLALRNTVRRPARFWLSVGLLASAGTVFVAGMSLTTGTKELDAQRTAQRYWDVDVKLVDAVDESAVRTALSGMPQVKKIEAWERADLGVAAVGQLPVTTTYPDQGHGSLSLTTLPENRTQPPPPLVGRWLEPGEVGAVVLNKRARNQSVPNLQPGDTVRLYIDGKPTDWRLAGIADEADSGSGAYVTAEGLAAASGGKLGQVNQLRIITAQNDEMTRQAVARNVSTKLTAAGIDVESSASQSQGARAASNHLGPVLAVLMYVALPLGVVGGIGLASTMSANILDRFREFGVLHAIGARPRMVRRIVVAEGVFLAITSCVVAVLPALVLTWLLGVGLGNLFMGESLPYVISGLAVGIWLLLVVIGSALATDAAATRASRITVREALAYL